jgi:ERF superfamily
MENEMNVRTEVKAATHKNVYVALAAAQSEMGPLIKGTDNPAFKKKYADLADLTSAVREPLTRHGLTYFHQMICGDRDLMRTVLVHGESETRIDCDVPLIVAKNDMQGMKSAATYAKRIGLESVTGVAPEDDDGNAAAKSAPVIEDRRPVEAPLRDAWRDGVEDSLPDNATPRQKAEAYSAAIIADFQSVKTAKTLSGRWDRHGKIINAMQERNRDLHEQIVDAYETHMMAITPKEAE